MLVIVGSWPRREMGEPEPRHQTIMINSFFFCVVNAALYGSISYVCMHTSELSFLEVGHMYIVILMSAIDMVSNVFNRLKKRNLLASKKRNVCMYVCAWLSHVWLDRF